MRTTISQTSHELQIRPIPYARRNEIDVAFGAVPGVHRNAVRTPRVNEKRVRQRHRERDTVKANPRFSFEDTVDEWRHQHDQKWEEIAHVSRAVCPSGPPVNVARDR